MLSTNSDPPVRKVLFDLGGVLVDWNPRHLYRQLFVDEAAMEHFLATVCTQAWNEEQDEGRPCSRDTRNMPSRSGLMIHGGARC